jgi:hypothetical protein
MKTGSADKDRTQQAIKMTLAGVIGQVGCLTLVVIGIALGAGLWLDNQFGTRPIITLVLVIASVPLTLFLMFRVVLTLAPKLQLIADSSVESATEESEGAVDETTEEE